MKLMKKLIVTLALAVCTLSAFAQPEVKVEANGTKIIKGFISKNDLVSDTSFKWFAENQKNYTPNPATVQTISAAKDSIYILAFGGTWCGDTKHILPQVYMTLDAAGFPADHFTLLGVDRAKKTINNLSESFNVTHVPTFIVLKNGKEIGRVVEYGKIGMPDKEIGEIIAGKR
jgi:thiol-disulfide isomerase/thioredoxin